MFYFCGMVMGSTVGLELKNMNLGHGLRHRNHSYGWCFFLLLLRNVFFAQSLFIVRVFLLVNLFSVRVKKKERKKKLVPCVCTYVYIFMCCTIFISNCLLYIEREELCLSVHISFTLPNSIPT